ncbi:beta-ketoacyl-ACP synthase III [Flocculibacter collagenilyticus]|uniref:beta-ketoacyl-ACP synthase III n=1 Tax=Flocculibacter collagenilyticus TaxID=2744479 RepID=UPI0018F46BBC|nr:beta-ketoacyl-ACP synthase III [Flocculibacter collagenilyticus]
MTNVVISGTGLFTPPHTVSNDELVASYNQYVDKFNAENAADIEAGTVSPMQHSSSEFIEKASGIKSRYLMYKDGVCDPNVMQPIFDKRAAEEMPEMVEMALSAAKEALAQANKKPEEIDLVIVAASNMQRPYPALAVEIQHYLGAKGYAYDMNVACSSATFGIINAINAVKTGNANVALVVNPEFTSPNLNFRNRDSHFIFGDVCTATIIEKEETAHTENAFRVLGNKQTTQFSNNIRCNYSYTDYLHGSVPAETPYFHQEGRKVFKELLPIVIDVIGGHLQEQALPVEDIKRMWLHQANINMNTFAVKKLLGRPAENDEAPLVLDEYANTASAGSVIAFHKYKQGFESGDKGILCSFGAGYSVGCISLEKV